MEKTIYTYKDNRILEHNITIHNYPFNDIELDNITSKISNSSRFKAIKKAIRDENIKAIEEILGNDIEEWLEFSHIFINFLREQYCVLYKDDLLTPFQKTMLNHPNFIVSNLTDLDEEEYIFYVKYLNYKYIDKKDFYYMLQYDKKSLENKLRCVMRDYFPTVEYTKDAILGNKYKLKDIPTIIYNLVSLDRCFNSIQEFIDNVTLDYTIKPLKYTIPNKLNDYYINNNVVYFNTYYYRDNRIILDPVTVTSDEYTIGLFREHNILRNSTIEDVMLYVIERNLSFKAILGILGSDEYKWEVVTKIILQDYLSDTYIQNNEKYILLLVNNKRFRVTDNILKYITIGDNILDENKLKSDIALIPHYIRVNTNRNVFYYLVYKFLKDTLNNDKYWKLSYFHLNIVNRYTGIINRENTSKFIKEILEDEGINAKHTIMYKVLTMLYMERYILNTDLSEIKTLKEYYQRVKHIQVNKSDKILESLLEL